MRAQFNTIDINHECFSHLKGDEKNEINISLLSGKAMIVEFVDEDGVFIAACVYELDGFSLHVRELAGKFVKPIGIIEAFSIALARAMRLHYLSYTARRKATRRIGEALGFTRDPEGFFVKAV